MFIKIKLERQDEAVMNYIEIAEDASLSEITQKLQPFINVPAGDMEIRTLGKVYKQEDTFKSIWEKEQKEGCIVMLYLYDNEDHEARFFSFLQLFETEAAVKESCRSLKHRPVRQISNATSKSSDVTIVPHLDTDDEDDVDDDDEDEDEEEKDGNEKQPKKRNTDIESTCSESTTTESDSSDSSDDSAVCRRSKSKKPGDKSNRFSPSPRSNIPKKLTKILDEFPCYHKESSQSVKPDTTTHNSAKSQKSTALEKEAIIVKKLPAANAKEKFIPALNTHDKASTHTVPESMTQNISPETREFIILVLKTTDDGSIEQTECLPILNVFFKQFYDSQREKVTALKFNDTNSPFKLHDGKLWIICEDEITFDWIIEQIGNQLHATYRAEKFRNHFQLVYYTVAIPNVCDSKDMLIVFHLLQKQNPDVDMSLWTVAQRREITGRDDEHYEKTVCNFCVNEMLTIGIDRASAEFLGEEFALKYCFWKLQFNLQSDK